MSNMLMSRKERNRIRLRGACCERCQGECARRYASRLRRNLKRAERQQWKREAAIPS